MAKQDFIEKQDLIDFLSKVDKKHVDELVDILTDFGSGRVALNSTVKDVLLKEKSKVVPYDSSAIELIVEEFYRYAGNSVLNQIIEHTSYLKMINNIYLKYTVFFDLINLTSNTFDKKNILNIKQKTDALSKATEIIKSIQTNSLHKKEVLILQTCLKNNYLSMSFKDRMDKCNNIYKEKLDSIPNPFIIKLLPSNQSWSLEADDRIILPFVVQIAWLRAKYPAGKIHNTDAEYPLADNAQALLVNESNDPIISIQPYTQQMDKKTEKLSSVNLSNLNQLLSNIPTALIKNETTNNNYAILNLSLDKLTSAKDGNGLRGMVHGYNQNGHFGITENVRIYTPNGLTNLVNAGLLMNLASTVVAQKHLADISQKLDEIKSAIDKVHDFQKNSRKADIVTSHQLCEHIMSCIRSGMLIPNDEKIKLQNFYTNISSINNHLKEDLGKLAEEIKQIKFDTWFNRSNTKDLKNTYDKFNEFQELSCQYFMSIDVMLAINSILLAMTDKNEDRYDDKCKYYYNLSKKILDVSMDDFSKLILEMQTHIHLIENNSKSITNFSSTDMANQVAFKSILRDLNSLKMSIEQKNKIIQPIDHASIKVLIGGNGTIENAEVLI